ncbi:MAG: helix-turn-helix domain-containing protein [Micromonosporaceae bacterium]|jgi:predicted transcriptional regulator
MLHRFVKRQEIAKAPILVREEGMTVAAGEDGAGPRERDRQVLLRYVERLALQLTDVGLPRMPARVFAYVLADDAERYTAAELAAGLQVSPAAISVAVRTLVQMGLLGREREPGARVDTYRIYDPDVWGTIASQQQRMIEPFERIAAEGVQLLGPDTPGGRRMRETQEFCAFFRRKMPELVEEWRAHRRKLFADDPPRAAAS